MNKLLQVKLLQRRVYKFYWQGSGTGKRYIMQIALLADISCLC